jgi:hypothetical protein
MKICRQVRLKKDSQTRSQVLLGFPITPDKFSEIFELSKKVAAFQIFLGIPNRSNHPKFKQVL